MRLHYFFVMYKFLFISTVALLTSCFGSPTDEPREDMELLKIWSVDHGTVGDARPILHDGKIIMSAGLYVYALDKETGEEIWKSQFEEDNVLQGRIFLINHTQVVAAHTDKIRAWNLSDGVLEWEFDYEVNGLEPRLTGKHISFGDKYGFTSERSRYFILNNSGDAEKVISLDTEYGVQGLAYYGGNLFIGQANTVHGLLTLGRITAMDAQTGDSLWAYDTENSGFIWAAPIVKNGVIYAGSSGNSPNNEFIALNSETGDLIWKHIEKLPTDNFLVGPKYVYVNTGGSLAALDKQDGSLAWRYEWTSSAGLITPVYLEGYIYHSDHGRIFVLDAETGKLVHEEPLPKGAGYFWHLAVSEDKLFAQTSYQLIAYEAWHLNH